VGGDSKAAESYVPGFELASIVFFAGVLAYWFVVGELNPRDS
jgi:hypothetical protein